MLKNQLYTIKSKEVLENRINAMIEIDPLHPIFKGHFPDVPVLPGAIMMQMAKEILEESEQKSLIIKKVGQIKFLQMLNPQKEKLVNWEMDIVSRNEGEYKIKARMFRDEITFLKMTALINESK